MRVKCLLTFFNCFQPILEASFVSSSISVPITQKFIEDFRLKTIGNRNRDVVIAQGEIRVDQLGRHLSRYEGQKVVVTMQIAKEKQVNCQIFLLLNLSSLWTIFVV